MKPIFEEQRDMREVRPDPQMEKLDLSGVELYEKKYYEIAEYPNASWPELGEGLSFDFDKIKESLSRADFDKIRENVSKILKMYMEIFENTIKEDGPVRPKIEFPEKDYIDLMSSQGKVNPVIPLCCWNLLEQVCTRAKAPERNEVPEPPSYEARVRAVSELLLMKLIPGGAFTWLSYKAVAGEAPEKVEALLEKLDQTISKTIVDSTDAALYLAGCAGIGCLSVVEDGVEYVAASAESLLGNKEKAEDIMSLDISGAWKDKLDELYGRDNWAAHIGDSVEQFGASATYIGLSVLAASGGVPAIAGAVGLALGKAGEKTKADFQKTGELTPRELAHGAISGLSAAAFACLNGAAAEKLTDCAPKIASEINTMLGGSVDPRMLKSIVNAFISGADSALAFTAFDAPEQISKELERALAIDPEESADWGELLKGAGLSFLTASVFTFISEVYRNHGKFYSTYEERLSRTPKENGEWEGDRGDSKFRSTDEEVNKVLKENGVDGIPYKDGCVDFRDVAKGEVKIDHMTSVRRGPGGNFEQADEALAKSRQCTPAEVREWREANHYVWHECNDMKTMQKVPFIINDKFGHLGGVGEYRRREKMLNEILGRVTENTKGGVFDV